ncbi:hypothetical protein BGZ75_004645 [Mortierella antarctica]|nr:hypothetical protein BGZ75_004645 [Mortierella antarctica]
MEGSGVRPKPADCFILFETVACFLKPLSHFILLLDNSLTPLWFRIAVDQLYWWLAYVITPVCYLVGTSYVIPVTEYEGKFAVYRTPATHGQIHSEVRIFHPTALQRNVFLVIGVVYPGLCCASFGIAAGVLMERGYHNAADILTIIQNVDWELMFWLLGCIIFYYGVKFTLILRAHIITTEARRGLPFAAFGLGNLKSRSPARYLFIVLQLTAFTAGSILLLSGLLNGIETWFKRDLLKSEDVRLYRFLVFMWSAPMTVTYFVKFALITVHCSRNKVPKPANASQQSTTLAPNYGGQSMELLTLHLHPNFSSFSESTLALERGLYELVTMHHPEDKWQEGSTRDWK